MLGLGTKLTSSSGLGDLRRDYNFLKGSLHSDIDFSRNSGATQTNSEGKICYAPENLITYTDDFSNSQDRFTYRSGHSISHTANQTDPNGGTDAALFANVTGSSANDFWKTVTGLGASAPYIPSFFIKRVSTTGTIRLANPVGGTSNWHINMAALPDDWVRITPSHSAVTVNTPFTAHTNGSGGLWFRSNDGSALSFYLAFPQVERTFDNSSSGKPLDFIENKTGSAVYKERFDYDKDGNSKGLLIEEARTNLLVQSQDFTTSWVKTNVNTPTIASNIIDPSGGYGSYKLTEDTADSFHFIYLSPTIGASAHTLSCYMKKGERTTASLMLTQSGNVGAIFNLETGQVDSVTGTGNTAQIVDAGNSWYRCSITNDGSADIGDFARIGVQNGALGSYQGDGVSGIYIYGGQLEQGSFPTSLIPTYGATADRAADIATISGTAFSGFFKDTEGTTIVDAQVAKGFDDENSYPRLYSYNDGTTADMIRVYLGSSNKFVGSIRKNSTAIGDKQAPLDLDDDDGGVFRFGQLYKNNRHVVFTNGVQGEVDTTVDVPEDLTQLNIGNRESGAASFNGWIRRFRYFNKAKADAQVLNLTDSSKLLDRYRGAKAAHSLRSLRDGRDNSPVTRIRREYDSYEADYTAAQVSNGELENDFKSEKQTTLPLDVSVEADEMIVGGDFTNLVTNGDFAASAGWTASNATINTTSQKAELDSSSSGSYVYQNLLVQGKSYTLTFTVDSYVANGGSANVFNNDGTTIKSISGNGTFSVSFTHAIASGNLFFYAQNGAVYNLSNVSVVEGGWSIGTGWATSGGVATHTGSVGNLAITGTTLKPNKQYVITLDVLTLADQTCNVYDTGTGDTYGNFASVGSHSLTFTKIGTADLAFRTSSSNCVIDNASLKQVNPIGTGFSTRLINADYKGKPLMRIRNQSNVEAQLYADDNDEISLSSSIKGSSQNILPASENFGEWSLGDSASASRASSLTDPFGGNNAWELKGSSSVSYSSVYSGLVQLTTGKNYTSSCYMKAGTSTLTRFTLYDSNTSPNHLNLDINWSTSGVPSKNTAGTSASVNNEKFELIGDGWYRISFNASALNDDGSQSLHIHPDRNTTSKTVYAYGAMLEETQYESTGTELVTNGDFSASDSSANGIADWVTASGPGIPDDGTGTTLVNGKLRFDNSMATGTDGDFLQAFQRIDVVAGRKYSFSGDFDILDGTVTGGGVRPVLLENVSPFGVRASFGDITADGTATGNHIAAITETVRLRIGRLNVAGGTDNDVVADIDNISLVEYSPKVSDYSQTPVVVSTHHSTTAQTLGEFSGKENLIRKSEDFSSNWINNNLDLDPDTSVTDPFGGTGAFKCVKTGNGAYQRLYDAAKDASGAALTGGAGDTYTFSIYVKPTETTVGLRMTATGTSSAFQDITVTPNVWQRISFSHTTTGAYTGLTAFVYPCGTGADNDSTTGGDAHIFGAQVNTNSLKTYQKTSGTALTGDVNVVNWYDQGGGEDFTQSTADYQPRLVMGSELVTDSGGKASVYFDGNDNLINSKLAGQNRLDSYIVIEPDLAADDSQVLLSGNSSDYIGLIFDDGNSSQEINKGSGTPSEFINGTQLAANATRNDVHDRLGSTSLFSLTDATTSSFTTFQMGWNNSSGSSLNYQGNLSEMVFFPNMDSSPKRFPIEQNMMNHFDVGLIDIDFEDGISVIGKSGTSTIGDAVLSAETTNPISGTQSLKIETTIGNNSSYPRFYTTVSGRMTETPVLGDRYKLTFDTKLISGTVNIRQIGFQDGSYDGSHFITPSSDDDDIILSGSQSHSVELTVTDLTSITNTLTFGLDGKNFQGTFLIDNIKVTKVGVTGYVTKLYDQTGNNCHALQDTAANQPQLVSGGDLIKSGNHPALEFTQTSPNYSNLEIHGVNAARADSWFVTDTSSTQHIYPSQHDNGARHGWIAQDGDSNVQAHLGYGGEPVRLYANGTLIGGYDITRDDVHTALNGRKLVHHQDGDTTDWTITQFGWYGQGNAVNSHIPWGYEGKMSEMIWYDSDQSSNRTGIESNINTHYNIY